MKKKIFFSLLLGVLVLVGATAILDLSPGFAWDFLTKTAVAAPLERVSFSSGGDMNGSYQRMVVKTAANQQARVQFEQAQWHHQMPEVKEYLVDRAVLDEVQTIFNKNKLARYEKAPQSKIMALDAGSSSYTFNFAATKGNYGQRIHLSSTQVLPTKAWQALKEIRQCVVASCEKGQLLPRLVVKKDENNDRPSTYALVKGKVNIKVVKYLDNKLYLVLGNGLEKQQSFAPAYKISQLGQPEVLVAEGSCSKQQLTLAKYAQEEQTLALTKPLVPGKYLLTFAGYETEFNIE